MKKYFLLTIIFINFNLKADVKIEDCASIVSDVKRLACYDYLVTGVSKTSEELSSLLKLMKLSKVQQMWTQTLDCLEIKLKKKIK